MLPLVILNLQLAAQDAHVSVVKAFVTAMMSLYRNQLDFICSSTKNVTVQMEEAWENLCRLKDDVCELVASENAGYVLSPSVHFNYLV